MKDLTRFHRDRHRSVARHRRAHRPSAGEGGQSICRWRHAPRTSSKRCAAELSGLGVKVIATKCDVTSMPTTARD